MKTMDRKMAQRRHGVTEQRARRRLKVVIGLVIVVAASAAVFWLIRSPLLAVDEVTVIGAQRSNPALAIERLGIAPGTPTISVDGAALEAVLLADPWIAKATVVVTWPGSVEVEVVEHEPIALIHAANGLAHVTKGGAVVQILDDPTGWPLIAVADPQTLRAGSDVRTPALLGALEFVVALPDELVTVTVVSIDHDQQLSATVGDYEVRLGRSVDMTAKAAAMAAIIGHGLEPGSSIDVTAPRRPAVANPQGEVEGEG